MIHFELNEVIQRPINEVFAFITAPENDRLWKTAVKEADPSDGPMEVGTTWRQVVNAPGGQTETIEECTAYVLNEKFAQYCPAPFPHGGTITFEAVNGGTKVNVSGYVEFKGMMKLLRPLLSPVVKKAARRDATRLKAVLEEQPRG